MPRMITPERAAFLVVREVYVWFGHTEEASPYTNKKNDARIMDTAANRECWLSGSPFVRERLVERKITECSRQWLFSAEESPV